MNEFDRFVTTFPPATPLLPLFHVCDAVGFRHIIQDVQLKTFTCKVFEKDLLYFFYGRPSYRIKANGLPTTSPAYLPVCFILDFTKTGLPFHVYPFDSGAEHANLFDDFLYEKWSNADFALTPGWDAPGRVVSCYYETNRNYFLEKPVWREIMPIDLESQSYKNLVENRGDTRYDNRRSSIEVAYESHVPLTPENFLAIVLPLNLMDDKRVTDFIAAYKAQPLTYITSHENPGGYHSAIRTAVFKFLADQQYLHP